MRAYCLCIETQPPLKTLYKAITPDFLYSFPLSHIHAISFRVIKLLQNRPNAEDESYQGGSLSIRCPVYLTKAPVSIVLLPSPTPPPRSRGISFKARSNVIRRHRSRNAPLFGRPLLVMTAVIKSPAPPSQLRSYTLRRCTLSSKSPSVPSVKTHAHRVAQAFRGNVSVIAADDNALVFTLCVVLS